jgi:tubulin--tyrosine ligase
MGTKKKTVLLCPTSWRAREILREQFRARSWEVLEDTELLDSAAEAAQIDLVWCAGRDVPWMQVLEGATGASVFYLRTAINRKADMHQMIEKYLTHKKLGNPRSILRSCVPETHIIDLVELREDEEDLGEHLLERKGELHGRDGCPLWVLKASDSNRGQDVHLFSAGDIGSQAMLDIIQGSQSSTWLLQKFVASPLLFRERKFHLRVIALACGDLRVHVHRHVVVIPAFSSYEGIVKDDKVDKFAFLTNHCVQSSHADYQAGRFAMLLDLCRDVCQRGMAPAGCAGPEAVCELLFQRICDVIAEVFAATKLSPTGFFPLPHCFELFGCDMMFDSSFNVWLLEINSDPSMTLYEGPGIQDKVIDILSDTLDVFLGADVGGGSAHSSEAAAAAATGAGGTQTWPSYWQSSGLTSVYVQGVPFFPATLASTPTRAPDAARPPAAREEGEGRGGAGSSSRCDGVSVAAERFPCVYSRAARYEGMAGLKVMAEAGVRGG